MRLTIIGALVLGAGSLAFRNWIINFDPAESIRSSTYLPNTDISRDTGYFLFVIGIVLLLVGGALLIYVAWLPKGESANQTEPEPAPDDQADQTQPTTSELPEQRQGQAELPEQVELSGRRRE
ncbi:MAG: hypothetical protein Q3979_08375 [Actinomycetaceae bacterium]|nr:hypothetical protein [Actinomycetaceae bacterium]